jgi:hypothetical protein
VSLSFEDLKQRVLNAERTPFGSRKGDRAYFDQCTHERAQFFAMLTPPPSSRGIKKKDPEARKEAP